MFIALEAHDFIFRPGREAKNCMEKLNYHFLGMFVAERCLVCDVEDRDRALLPVSKSCCAAGEELL